MKSLALDWFLDSVFPERLGCHYAKISTPSFADTPRYEGGGSLGILIWLWFSLYWVEGACPNNHEFCFGLCLSMCVLPSFSYLSRVLPWTKLCRTALIAFLPWQSLCFMRWKDGGSCYCVFGLAESQHLLKFVEAQESIKQIIPRIHRCRTLPWCMRQRYKLQRGARAFEPHRQRCCIERHLRSSSDLWPCALATSIWSLRLHWYDFIPRHLFWEDVALRNIVTLVSSPPDFTIFLGMWGRCGDQMHPNTWMVLWKQHGPAPAQIKGMLDALSIPIPVYEKGSAAPSQ